MLIFLLGSGTLSLPPLALSAHLNTEGERAVSPAAAAAPSALLVSADAAIAPNVFELSGTQRKDSVIQRVNLAGVQQSLPVSWSTSAMGVPCNAHDTFRCETWAHVFTEYKC